MIDIYERPSLKYFLFGSLYFSEGITFALCTVFLMTYFKELDISIINGLDPQVYGIFVSFVLFMLVSFLSKLFQS